MDRWRAIRVLAMLLLMSLCVVSVLGPVPALAMGGMRPGMMPEEEIEEEPEKIPFDYVHPTYRGIGYGTEWNYALTFHYASRDLWLYGDGNKILFRQQVASGAGGVTQLNLWTRYVYDELAICLAPNTLDVLALAGVEQILLQNGNQGDAEATQVIYRVADLQQLMTRAEVDPEKVIQLWIGEETGPRFVLKSWQRVQMEPEDDPGQTV